MKQLGQAMKKMAQRAMWRGNRNDAQAIEQHGVYGMRDNLNNQEQNVITQKAPIINTSNGQSTSSMKTSIKSAVGGAVVNTSHNDTSKKNDDTKKLGGNIMDALQ